MDDSTAGHIELEYIVVDLVREKRLELVNGTHVLGLNSLLSISLVYPYIRHCRKAKFNCPLPGSPSGRPLIEAPNRTVLANSWNGYEGLFYYLFGVATMVIW